MFIWASQFGIWKSVFPEAIKKFMQTLITYRNPLISSSLSNKQGYITYVLIKLICNDEFMTTKVVKMGWKKSVSHEISNQILDRGIHRDRSESLFSKSSEVLLNPENSKHRKQSCQNVLVVVAQCMHIDNENSLISHLKSQHWSIPLALPMKNQWKYGTKKN